MYLAASSEAEDFSVTLLRHRLLLLTWKTLLSSLCLWIPHRLQLTMGWNACKMSQQRQVCNDQRKKCPAWSVWTEPDIWAAHEPAVFACSMPISRSVREQLARG